MPLWWQKPRAEWTPHDWLYAAAKELLLRGEEDPTWARAATLVMEFADTHAPDKAT